MTTTEKIELIEKELKIFSHQKQFSMLTISEILVIDTKINYLIQKLYSLKFEI